MIYLFVYVKIVVVWNLQVVLHGLLALWFYMNEEITVKSCFFHQKNICPQEDENMTIGTWTNVLCRVDYGLYFFVVPTANLLLFFPTFLFVVA